MNDMLSPKLQAVLDCNQAILEADFSDEPGSITVATLIIHDDHDASIPLKEMACASGT